MKRPDVLLIDNYDSFTWNLAHLLERCGASVTVVRNDALPAAEALRRRPSHLVISPGPGVPERAGITCDLLRRAVGRVPLLGVCLGHQALAVAFGGNLRRADPPVHGETCSIVHDGAGLYRSLPERFPVARYHSLVIQEHALPSAFVVDARSETEPALIMGIRHRTQAAFGVQFHPESFLTVGGETLIANFLGTSA